MQVLKAGGWILGLLLVATPVRSQSLFESSQSGTKESLVSSNLSLGGFFHSASYLSQDPVTNKLYFQSAYAQAALSMEASSGSMTSAYAGLWFRYGNEFREPLSQVYLREARIRFRAGPFTLNAGRLITPWGKASVFNPTEKITPLDPTFRSPEEDDMRLSYWGLQGLVNLGQNMRFSVIWKPLYTASVLLIDPVPMPEYVRFLEPEYPGPELDQGSYGLRYDLFTRQLDLSLYWFEGYHHWPGIAYHSFVAQSGSMELEQLDLLEKAYQIRMAGVDMEIPVSSWILRGEMAWQKSKEDPLESEHIPSPEFSYAAEVERSGSYYSLVAGYYGKYIGEYTASSAEPSLETGQEEILEFLPPGIVPTSEDMDGLIREKIRAFNRLYNYQLEEIYHSVYLAGRVFLLQDRLELTLPVIHHFTTGEWILQPWIAYSPADDLKIAAGYSGLLGPEKSLHDLAGPSLNAVYLSLKVSF
jgi:hypothetical protein